ncbi:MAG: hypothetical protein ABIS92_01330 [Polyangia bacterium]
MHSLEHLLGNGAGRKPGRSAALLVVGVAAAFAALRFVNGVYPVGSWLAVPVGTIAAWQLLLNLAWLGGGAALTRRFLPADLPRLERLVIAVAVGVAGFAFGLFLLGAFGILRTIPVLILATAMFASGLPDLVLWLQEWLRERPEPSASGPQRFLRAGVAIFGIIGLSVAYLGIFTPDAINYDARWWHLKIAEDYAREGRLIPFPGNWVNAYPHLASLIHTWDFLVPGLPHPATRLMMVLHTEFSLFVWTLVGVSAAVRWVTSNYKIRGAWAALFLFPGVIVYDGNMGGASDHAAAFFMLPLLIISVRAVHLESRSMYALWGVVAGTALITKLQAVYALIPLSLLLVAGTIRARASVRVNLARLLHTMPWAVGAFVVATLPHFGLNCLYHGNPAYPLLQDWFAGSHPTVPDAPLLVREILMDFHWKAPEALGPKFREALHLLITFSFKPHYSYSGNIPTFGFLFTLSLAFLPFLSGAKRTWLAATVALGAVFSWACTVRVDRNLQTILPLLVVATAGLLHGAWRAGQLARVGVAALVSLQLVWGADHLLSGMNVGGSLALIHSGLEGTATSRFSDMSADYFAVSRLLPPDAVVLLHQSHLSLGFNRPVFLDIAGFQGSIDYRGFSTARDFHDRLRALGVTHIVAVPGNQTPYRQEDAIFHSLLAGLENPPLRTGSFEIYELPAVPRPQRSPLQVLTVGMGGYADGLYDVRALNTCQTLPGHLQTFALPKVRTTDPSSYDRLALESDVVLVGSSAQLDPALTKRLANDYQPPAKYPDLLVYVHRGATSP